MLLGTLPGSLDATGYDYRWAHRRRKTSGRPEASSDARDIAFAQSVPVAPSSQYLTPHTEPDEPKHLTDNKDGDCQLPSHW
jgi:hypothetical protein